MVKRLCIALIIIFASLPALAAAPAFTATVDENSVAVGQSFVLHLNLANADAKSAPDISALDASFIIAGQAQSQNTTIINGNISSSNGWELTLIPKTEGHLTIPSLVVETSDGTLRTQAITIEVSKGAAPQTSAFQNGRTTITATASNLNPYKGQPIFYTVKIIARSNLVDLALGDINLTNAVIEKQGNPKIYNQSENGMLVNVVEARYIITPLSTGKITIPPVVLRGRMEMPQADPFADVFNSNMQDPLQMMRAMQMRSGFVDFRPFTLASNEVVLNVKPAAAQMDPWLPLNSLEIKESYDPRQPAKVGESITRKITMLAHGGVGKQLPNLEAEQNHDDFKVYADKPVAETSINGEDIIGKREETYTLIPTKGGKLTLPEIKVAWWDIRNNRAAYAILPARVVDVQGGVEQSPANTPAAAPNAAIAPKQNAPAATSADWRQNPYFFYSALGLIIFLICTILWLAYTHNKPRKRQVRIEPELAMAKKPVMKIQDVEAVTTPQELNDFIRRYAHEHWGSARNASLETIFANPKLQSDVPQEKITTFTRELAAALYSGRQADMGKLKNQAGIILRSLKSRISGNPGTEKLAKLNPDQ